MKEFLLIFVKVVGAMCASVGLLVLELWGMAMYFDHDHEWGLLVVGGTIAFCLSLIVYLLETKRS